jgi:hypothetical protein
MRHYWLMLSILTASVARLAASLKLPWNVTRVKHKWDAIPANWEHKGYPHADMTIDLYIALKSHREDALIDALYEVSDPEHPKHVPPTTATRAYAHICRCSFLDIADTFPRSRLPSSLRPTQQRSGLSIRGLSTTVFHPPLSQGRTVETG